MSDEQSQVYLSYAMTMSKSRKSEFTKLSDEQSQVYLSYAMTMSKSRKSEFMEINNRPNPNEAFPNPKIPSLCFIKNVVKNPRIIIGDYTYYDDVGGTQGEKTRG